jgi:hypothetical protein
MMLLRPGSFEMCDSPRPRGLPSRCDLRAFNYLHTAPQQNTLKNPKARPPNPPRLPATALPAPRLCQSLPVASAPRMRLTWHSRRLMEPPRALESSTARLCVPRVASSAKPIARAFDSSRTTVRACVRSALVLPSSPGPGDLLPLCFLAHMHRDACRRRPPTRPATRRLFVAARIHVRARQGSQMSLPSRTGTPPAVFFICCTVW